MMRYLWTTLALMLAAGTAWGQASVISESDILDARPRMRIHPDSLSAVTARIETDGGNVAEFGQLYAYFEGLSGEFMELPPCWDSPSNPCDELNIQDGRIPAGLVAPLSVGSALYWATKNSSEYTTEHGVIYAKLVSWAETLVSECQSHGFDMLSISDYTGGNDRGNHDNWEEHAKSAALWTFMDAVEDTLENGDAGDQQTRRDLLEIAVAWWDHNLGVWGWDSAQFTDGVPVGCSFGYGSARYLQSLIQLFILLAHIGDPWSGTLTLWDGVTTYSNTLYDDRLAEWWDIAQRQILYDAQSGGASTPGYIYRHKQVYYGYWLPLHIAVPSQSPLTAYSGTYADLVPWWVIGISGRNWHGYRSVGEHPGGAPNLLDGGPIYDWYAAIGRTYAFLLDDMQAIHQLDPYVATEGLGNEWMWLEMLYGDSLRVRDTAPPPASRHFGAVYEAPLGPTYGGRWSTMRSDRTAPYAPFERSGSLNGTIVANMWSGPANTLECGGHEMSTAGHLELWYDGVLMTCRGSDDAGIRAFAWTDHHKFRLLNCLQIDVLTENDDAAGFPHYVGVVGGGSRPENYHETALPKFRYSWVSRHKSFANGAYERVETEAAYPNDLIPTQNHAYSAQDSTFREVTNWGPYFVVKDGTVPVQSSTRVSTNWRSSDPDALWSWDGTRTGGTEPNAHGGTPDASSTNSTYVEYVKEGTGGTPYRMRVSVPWVSTDWAFTMSQGPASNGLKWQGEYASGTFDNSGDLSYEFHLLSDGYDQRRPRAADDPLVPPWDASLTGGSLDTIPGADLLDYGGYIGGGTARVTMGGTGTDDGVHMIALQVIEIGPDGEAFAVVEQSASVPDSLVGINILDADTTLVHVSPQYIGTRTAGGALTIGDAITASGARVFWTGLTAGTYGYWHEGDSLGVVTADSSGVVSFLVPDIGDNVIQLSEGQVVADETPPDDPSGFAAATISSSVIRLSWDALSEAGTTVIERDGMTIDPTAGVSGTTYDDTGLEAETQYAYRIRHRDTVGNLSAWSGVLTPTTSPAGGDDVGPDPPDTLVVAPLDDTTAAVHWSEATDPSGIAFYTLEIQQDGGAWVEVYSGPQRTRCVEGLSGDVCARVSADDQAGNPGDPTDPVCVTLPEATDTTPPTTPTLGVGTITETTFQFLWSSSTDPESAIDGYWLEYVTHGDSVFVSHPTLTHTRTGLSPDEAVVARVRGVNEVGLSSPYSATTGGETLQDTTAPTAPTLTQFVATGSSSVFGSWSASFEQHSPPVTYEAVLMNSVYEMVQVASGAGLLSAMFTGLTPDSTYALTVRGSDAAGNPGAYSDTLTVMTDPIAAAAVPMPAMNRTRILGEPPWSLIRRRE